MSKNSLLKIADLSFIALQEKELQNLSSDVDKILEWVATLNEVNTEGVPPTSTMFHKDYLGVLRKDETNTSSTTKDLMSNAAKNEHGYFVVPKIIE